MSAPASNTTPGPGASQPAPDTGSSQAPTDQSQADFSLSLPAPVKLNLFLHIIGRRADGYHLLQTVFQLLDHGDLLHFQPAEGLSLSCSEPALAREDNLVLRAARLLQAHTGCRQGAHIHLDKRVPMGGGLGGGSSDAATTLVGLNHLWGCGLSRQALAELGLQLGADVPVFVLGRSAWAEGVGEKLQPLQLPKRWFLVLTPPCHASTPEIFSHPQLTRDTPPLKIPGFPVTGSRNDCQSVACQLYPEIREALDWLGQFGQASMTGTGSSLFADFGQRREAEAILAQLPDRWRGFVASGVEHSPLYPALDLALGSGTASASADSRTR